jgi:hypothetical protein
MPSRITVFDPNTLYAIAEITAATTRSWILNDIGRCQFQISSFTDPNCSRGTLQYGNFVLIEHIPTQDEFGNFHGTLPPWIGIILPPQEWEFGLLTVTAYSAEALLQYRPMPFTDATGSAGQIFDFIIRQANALGGVNINEGSIEYPDSDATTIPLRLSALEEARNLSAQYNQDFDLTCSIGNSTRQLYLQANWYAQKGYVVGNAFTDGAGGNMIQPKLNEQGSPVNVVFGYNSTASNTARLSSAAHDDDSAGDYGVLGVNKIFSATNQAGIDKAVKSYLSQNKRPAFTLDLTALDVGNTFTDLQVGNVWNVRLNSVGFYGGAIGFRGTARITGVEYDDLSNTARLTTQILSSGLTEDNYA